LELPRPNNPKNLRVACCSIGTELFAVVVTLAPTVSRPDFTFGIYFLDVFFTTDTLSDKVRLTKLRPLLRLLVDALRLLEDLL
jgi:hypothetical protein